VQAGLSNAKPNDALVLGFTPFSPTYALRAAQLPPCLPRCSASYKGAGKRAFVADRPQPAFVGRVTTRRSCWTTPMRMKTSCRSWGCSA